jgi:non-specific serine/threonine protein kinase
MSEAAAGSASDLPRALTTFVGRRREIAAVRRGLTTHRLVTLTGLGGVGKTRLALQVARDLRPGFADGVRWVEFDGVTGPDAVPAAVRRALGRPARPTETGADDLIEELAGRAALLVLDNCEQVRAPCAALVDALLRRGDALRVLVTSRQPLGLPGEVSVPLAPFAVPDAEQRARPRELIRYDAVRLLLDRAADVTPGFRLTADNAEAVAEICRCSDGLPLALEVAAARLRALTPQQVAQRLPRSRHRWTVAHDLGPQRQRSEWDNVDWSYRLCDPQERLLWARLSVFREHFPLDAAEAVGEGGELPRSSVAEVVGALVDKSVLQAGVSGAAARYRLPAAWRDFGAERLAERGEAAAVARRRRDWYAGLCPAADRRAPLSPRETQVAELVARGLTDKQIGEHLSIARRTAESHVAHILVKLNLTRRAQVAAWYTAQARSRPARPVRTRGR